jgi:hypothetical protein
MHVGTPFWMCSSPLGDEEGERIHRKRPVVPSIALSLHRRPRQDRFLIYQKRLGILSERKTSSFPSRFSRKKHDTFLLTSSLETLLRYETKRNWTKTVWDQTKPNEKCIPLVQSLHHYANLKVRLRITFGAVESTECALLVFKHGGLVKNVERATTFGISISTSATIEST